MKMLKQMQKGEMMATVEVDFERKEFVVSFFKHGLLRRDMQVSSAKMSEAMAAADAAIQQGF